MQNKQILQLLTPSWVVNVIGIAVAVLVTAAGIVVSQYQGSELQQQIFANQANVDTQTTAGAYESITNNVAENSFLGSLPLLLTWAAVGLVVYFFSMSIARSFGSAASLREQLGYVHLSRQEVLRQTFISLGIRLAATVGWFIFIKFSLSVLVPYALAAASIAAQEFSLQSVGYAVLSATVLYVMVALHAVFLRLIVLKPRLFGG